MYEKTIQKWPNYLSQKQDLPVTIRVDPARGWTLLKEPLSYHHLGICQLTVPFLSKSVSASSGVIVFAPVR